MVFSSSRRDINSSSAIKILIRTPRPCTQPPVGRVLWQYFRNAQRIREISRFLCSAPSAQVARRLRRLRPRPGWKAFLLTRGPPKPHELRPGTPRLRAGPDTAEEILP